MQMFVFVVYTKNHHHRNIKYTAQKRKITKQFITTAPNVVDDAAVSFISYCLNESIFFSRFFYSFSFLFFFFFLPFSKNCFLIPFLYQFFFRWISSFLSLFYVNHSLALIKESREKSPTRIFYMFTPFYSIVKETKRRFSFVMPAAAGKTEQDDEGTLKDHNSNYCLLHKVYYSTTWCPYCGHKL